MDDAAQAFLNSKIMDNIHKYFYLILYTAYIRQPGTLWTKLQRPRLLSPQASAPSPQTSSRWARPSCSSCQPRGASQEGLQGEPRNNHPRHLPDSPPHVRRHASGGSQEACQVQVRLQDPDEAVAQGAVEPGGGAD